MTYLRTFTIILLALSMCLTACKKDSPHVELVINNFSNTVVILEQEDISIYFKEQDSLANGVFSSVNGFGLTTPSSIAFHNGYGYILDASYVDKVVVVSLEDFSQVSEINGVHGIPLDIPFVTNNNSGYVASSYGFQYGVEIIGLDDFSVTGTIPLSRRLVDMGKLDNQTLFGLAPKRLYKLDLSTNTLIDSLVTISDYAEDLTIDPNGKVWVYESAVSLVLTSKRLKRIDPVSMTVDFTLGFPATNSNELHGFTTDETGASMYFIESLVGVFKMSISTNQFIIPSSPIIQGDYDFVSVDSDNGNIYCSKWVYPVVPSQPGFIYSYSSSGVPLDTLEVGANPLKCVFSE
jgi:hypothetical protein